MKTYLKQRKQHFPAFVLLTLALTSTKHEAAIITWGDPTPVSTEAGAPLVNVLDVSTNGILVEAMNAAADSVTNTVTVNGVEFQPGTLFSSSSTADVFPGTTENADYDQLLSNVDFNGGVANSSIQIGGGDLIPGDLYEVQVWFVDTRTNNDARVVQFGDGEVPESTVDLNDEFAIGTFIADGTDQTLTILATNFGAAHINAYQVRRIVPNPLDPLVEISTTSDLVSDDYTIDVLFSEDVTGLEASDFVVVDGTASGLVPQTGPATSYSVTITPSASGQVTVSLPAGAADGSDADPSLASNFLTTTFVPPGSEQAVVTLSTMEVADPVLGPYVIDVVFDEDVEGLDVDDFQIVNGTISDLLPAVGPASSFTATITPIATGNVEVTLLGVNVFDVDDNLPTLDSNTLITAFTQPSIPTVVLSHPDSGAVVSGPYTIGITFSEDVSDLAITDFTVSNGTSSNLVTIDAANYTLDITPIATGVVSVILPAGSVVDTDGELQTNPEAIVQSNNFPASTSTSGTLNLSAGPAQLGPEEPNAFFTSPIAFGAFSDGTFSDQSFNDIPWTDGVNSGTFDLSFEATSSLIGVRRGSNGAFGTADDATGSGLIDEGESLILDNFEVSDLTGALAGGAITNVQFIGIFLGNETIGDGATINGLDAFGAAGGTNLQMRNAITQTSTATIIGTGGDGFSINGIDVSFDVSLGDSAAIQIISCEFNDAGGFDVTANGLNSGTGYELRFSPDLVSPFTLVDGSQQVATASQMTFTDSAPPLPGSGFYQLFITP